MRSPRQVTHFTKYWMLGLLIAGCGGDLRSDTLLGKSVFIDPTNGASLSVPSNANRLVLKVWGYGGNGGTESRGGAGGYVTVTYNLTYKVGTGAISLNFDQGTPGGNQGVSTTGGKIAGRGAKSYIVRTVFTVTPNQMWQHRLYVGGGGGGGGTQGGNGGAAGGSVGESGGGGLNSSGGSGSPIGTGGPGSDAAGQIGGGGFGGNGGSTYSGIPGGGGGATASAVYTYGGGGGGSGVTQGGGGGGGGASSVGINSLQSTLPGLIVSSGTQGGTGQIPAMVNDPDYPGSSVGYGGVGTTGFPGAVVALFYQATAPAAPSITSPLSKTMVQGQNASYTITGTNNPTSFGATGLPAGLSVNSTNGNITGIATTAGTNNSTISATNSTGTGQATLVWTIQADTTAPTVPTALQSRMLTSTSFRISWAPSTDNVGVTAYEIKRDSTSLGTTSTGSIDVTGTTVGTTYAMTVRARDAAGNWTSWSAPLSVQQATVTPPTVPPGLAFAERTDTTITMVWGESTGSLPIVGYTLYRGGVAIVTTSERVYADTGLTASTSYSYTVRALDVAGNQSSLSSAVVVSTNPNPLTDTDHDGVPDAMETLLGTSPSVAGSNDSTNQTELKINQPPK